MTTPEVDYQRMMTVMSEAGRRRDRARENAEQSYQDSADQAAGELARVESEASSAARWALAAAAQVLDVDREATRLWEQLRRARGVQIRTLGEVPEPAPVETLPRVVLPRVDLPRVDLPRVDLPRSSAPDSAAPDAPGRRSARELLASAAERIEETVRPPTRRPLPRWALTLLPLIGALVAGVTGLLATGLVTLGSTQAPGGAAIRGLGWLAFLVAPSAGVPVAAAVSHRRLQAKLDIGGIGLTLLGGMVAAALLSLSFASTR